MDHPVTSRESVEAVGLKFEDGVRLSLGIDIVGACWPALMIGCSIEYLERCQHDRDPSKFHVFLGCHAWKRLGSMDSIVSAVLLRPEIF